MQACFADLSRAELAHVRRCQFVAQAEGMAVVSSGVLAAPVASAPAGAHFWLVSSGLSGVVSVVWLAEGRLCCGCSRRRAGALTCSHAQTVRLWLLAAAGVRVPALAPIAPEPEPDPPCTPSGSSSPSPAGDSSPAPAGELAPVVCESCQQRPARYATDEGPMCAPCWRYWVSDAAEPEQPTPIVTPVVAPVADPAPAVICPACEQPAPAGVIHDWGICAACLDDLAAAEGQPRPRRCALLDCRELAIGETAYGAYCAKHLPHYQRMAAESETWHRRRAAEAAALDGVVWTFGEDGGEDEPVTLAEA